MLPLAATTAYTREVKNFAQWRAAARPLLAAGVAPSDVMWSDWRRPNLFRAAEAAEQAPSPTASSNLASSGNPAAPNSPASSGNRAPEGGPGASSNAFASKGQPSISRELLTLLEELALYRDASRWDLLYRLTWRVMNENRELLENDADPDVQLARQWSKAIHRDVHKMHAFVRFHETEATDGTLRYVAWFEPAHEILEHVAPFFEQRFPNMHWMIATPDGAAVWDGTRTTFVESPAKSTLSQEDATHGLWRAYYRNICNVARINPKVMQREMPQRYWRHLPEASEIDVLIRDGKATLQRNLVTPPTTEDLRVPAAISRTLEQIALPASSVHACRRCDLWRNATQAVTGEGPANATIMLVGEQPGDEEDVRGRPFMGPAGRLLDEALREGGIERSELFVTNAVKHFKWEPRGKLRLHKRPSQQEAQACSTWLDAEIQSVSPRVIVALGATAIRAVAGMKLSVEDARQMPIRHPRGAEVICTYHPSAILRATDDRRAALLQLLQTDLQRAHATVTLSARRTAQPISAEP
jgi:uracil-DNA glycosylase